MPEYLFYFASTNADFRMAEIDALADLYGVKISYDKTVDMVITPFLLVEVPSEEYAIKIAQRSVSLRGVYELWGDGKTYDECIASLQHFRDTKTDLWAQAASAESTFKFVVEAYGRKYSRDEMVERIEKFKWISWKGTVKMKDPSVTYYILEDVGDNMPHDLAPKRVMFTKLVSLSRRDLVETYTLKKRKYLGTTSMESEISFYTANQALSRPGALIIDPFVGTGSLLLTAAHFGARVIGCDIDMNVLKGKIQDKNVYSNFDQYGLRDRLVSLIRWDHSTRNCFRQQPIFDAIVCDPPYGVRAGAKKVGKKPKTIAKREKAVGNVPHILPVPANSDWHTHVTQTVAYSVVDVLSDLLDFAARTLVVGGRLVYWLPTLNEHYKPSDVPQHPCFTLVANSRQMVSLRFSRHLITMRKDIEYDAEKHGSFRAEYTFEEPAHANFAMKYLRDPRRHDNRHNVPRASKDSAASAEAEEINDVEMNQDDTEAAETDQNAANLDRPSDFPNKKQKSESSPSS